MTTQNNQGAVLTSSLIAANLLLNQGAIQVALSLTPPISLLQLDQAAVTFAARRYPLVYYAGLTNSTNLGYCVCCIPSETFIRKV